MIRIEPMTARGTVRFGSRLSSASGAAASQPVIAKIANTTPRNRPCKWLLWKEFEIQFRFTPPAPGLANPLSAIASTITASKIPSTISKFTDSSTPRQAVQATNRMRNTMNHHHSKVMFYSAFNVDCSVEPMKDPTCAITTG